MGVCHPSRTLVAAEVFNICRDEARVPACYTLAPPEGNMRDLESLTAADFKPWTRGQFRVHGDSEQPFDVELIEVTEADAGSARRQFALVFRGGPSPPLPQRIYRVKHEALGALDIFLVPLGPDEVGQRYEAIFT